MQPRLTFTIASVPDRESLVAELWKEDEMWGEILILQNKGMKLTIYPNRFGEPWDFYLIELQKVLEEAKTKLQSKLEDRNKYEN